MKFRGNFEFFSKITFENYVVNWIAFWSSSWLVKRVDFKPKNIHHYEIKRIQIFYKTQKRYRIYKIFEESMRQTTSPDPMTQASFQIGALHLASDWRRPQFSWASIRKAASENISKSTRHTEFIIRSFQREITLRFWVR